MTILLFTFLSLLLIVNPSVFAKQAVNYLQDRNGVKYLPNREEPFTGRFVGWHENGNKKSEGTFKDGKTNGLMTVWHENGNKKSEGTFKDGKREGRFTTWDENRNKIHVRIYVEGECLRSKAKVGGAIPPSYPKFAREQGQEGVVVLQLKVNQAGTVDSVRTHKSSGFLLLDKSAVQAVKNWRFEPAKECGEPVSVTLQVPIRFDLDEQ